MTITGGCLCGAVRYTIEAEPKFIRHCWCRDCQYIGAGAGTVNVFFPTEAVKVEGALAEQCAKLAASLYRRARRHPRRSRARQAANGDLDLERAKLGRLRARHPARAETSPTAEGEGLRAMLLKSRGVRRPGGRQ